MLREILF